MRKEQIHPPKWPLRFLRLFVKKEYLEEIEGDMEEVFRDNLEKHSGGKGRGAYFLEVLDLVRPALIKNFKGSDQLNLYGMFKSYFKVGVRNILKYKAFSSINVFGLAVAMSVSMLIILMLADQKSYDQFHEKKDRIYRVLTDPADHKRMYATGPSPLAETLRDDYPIIAHATRLLKGFGGDAVYDENYAEIKGYFSDPDFFRVFSFKLEYGDPFTALEGPNTMVVTKNIATRLFGNENPVGKTIDFADRGIDMFTDEGRPPVDWGAYTITGVLEDNHNKTHLKFDVLVSSASLERLYKEKKIYDASGNWLDYSRCYTYALIEDAVGESTLNEVLSQLASLKYDDHEQMKGSLFIAQPLTKITPGPVLGNNQIVGLPMFVYFILGGLALVIMISACLNYTNLSLARAVARAKEIGVRKVNGARRKDLIYQFLCESMITVFLALLLACIFLVFVKSAFLDLWINQYLSFDLDANVGVYLIYLAFALLIGLVAGIFPALTLSRYQPARALKNLSGFTVGRLGVRKVLTVSQFVISLVFIVTSMVVFNQFRYYMEYEYGFNAHNVVNVNLQSNDFQLVKNALASTPGVKGISGCSYYPATGRNDNTRLKKTGGDEFIEAIDLRVDENFIQLLEIDLVAGRNLPSYRSDTSGFILVNETAANAFGFAHAGDMVGELFEERGGKKLQVVGVVENFTFFLLFSTKPTGPIVLRNEPVRFNFASVKIESENEREVIARLEKNWKTVDPIHPLKYEFYAYKLANYNQAFFDLVSVVGFFGFLAITIACLGLLGMAIYTTERRTKEIGIRKVLGANSLMLAFLLSKEFLVLLGVSVFIAAPLSYFLNSLWLDFLVVRVELGFGTIFLGSLLLLVLSVATIAPQTFQVSNRNPVDSLRNE